MRPSLALIIGGLLSILGAGKTAGGAGTSSLRDTGPDGAAAQSIGTALDCGKPLRFLAGDSDAGDARASLNQISADNLQALKSSVGSMTDDELPLFQLALRLPGDNIHRSDFSQLHAIL